MNTIRIYPLFAVLTAVLIVAGLSRPAGAGFAPDLPLTGGEYPKFLCGNYSRAIATDSRHNIHVIYGAFELHGGIDQEVIPTYMVYDRYAGAWQPAQRLSKDTVRSVCWWHTSITTDCGDNTHMLWVNLFGGPAYRLNYKRRNADGTWGGIEDVGVDGTAWIERPSVAVDWLGNV